MSEVKRYGLEYNPEAEGDYMAENPNGVWVRYCDYAALRARLEEVEKERDQLAKRVQDSIDIHNRKAWEAAARAERAEAALATARRDALLDCRLIATEALTGDADGRDIYARIDALIAQEEPKT